MDGSSHTVWKKQLSSLFKKNARPLMEMKQTQSWLNQINIQVEPGKPGAEVSKGKRTVDYSNDVKYFPWVHHQLPRHEERIEMRQVAIPRYPVCSVLYPLVPITESMDPDLWVWHPSVVRRVLQCVFVSLSSHVLMSFFLLLLLVAWGLALCHWVWWCWPTWR